VAAPARLPTSAPSAPSTSTGPRLSAVVLVAANCIPLIGVLAGDWTVFSIVLLYWCENVIVGAFNVLRLIACRPDNPVVWVGKAFLVPFFMVHYGGFTTVHGALVMAMFSGRTAGIDPTHPTGILAAIREQDIGYAVLALALSHGVSFVHNFLLGGEFRRVSPAELMMRPYARVMVLHLTILAGGFLVLALHSPLPALVMLIALKTAIDLGAHVTERKKLGGGTGSGSPASSQSLV
jgi:hypothetical protein